ncbi:hypothetical protein NP493_1952g00004 [Ridgeia piscesae]|uniref:Uncharacterized protein n=1 Tax=Ridgeia piscesae TaxID=27915 RepID=A0AAD9N5Z9_RIDPI|nr:hypothetical protein NP493_1952g00004 [Ridgeia piscesae]
MWKFKARVLQAQRTTSGTISLLSSASHLSLRRGAIGVQLTATARRHPALGRGTKRVAMGRPVCVSKSSREEAKKKKRRAPHNLAHVVSANIALAKKH